MTTVKGFIGISKVETDEEPFRPGAKVIRAVMKPTAEEDPYVPAFVPWESFPAPVSVKKRSVVLDIETTGLNPWESRIICIGVLDVALVETEKDIAEKTIVFYNEDEALMLRQFLDWFYDNGFTQIIGYNVSFDHRFIFSHCMKYRMTCGAFRDADLYDMAQVMKQVKTEFVFGWNKVGSLGQWMEYLLGTHKSLNFEQLLKAYKEGRIKDIIDYNREDIRAIYQLWALSRYTGELYG